MTQQFYARNAKRLFDVILVIPALAVSLPLFAIVAIGVYADLGAPILFRQNRPGLRGCPFVLYKFRSMLQSRLTGDALASDGARLTRFGRFLRSTSLDELPELWNVLRGDMSLVGPRPLLTQYLDRYTPEQARRHEVRPGLTGWAQVNGRNAISWEEKFVLDVWYVEHLSFWVDLKILSLTLFKVLGCRNIQHAGEATMSEFLGRPNPLAK